MSSPDIATIVGAIAAVASVASALIAYQTGILRQRLHYWISKVVPLSPAPLNSNTNFEATYGKKSIRDPHLLKVQLISRGRKDIQYGDFDHDKPLLLDFGMPIVSVLPVDSSSETTSSLKLAIVGRVLEIGPCLISKRRLITIYLLTEGGHINLKCTTPLKDIKVRKRRSLPPFINSGFALGVTIALILLSIAFAVLALLSGHGLDVTRTIETIPPGTNDVNAILAPVILLTTQRAFAGLLFVVGPLAVVAAVVTWGLRKGERRDLPRPELHTGS